MCSLIFLLMCIGLFGIPLTFSVIMLIGALS
jgi:hypothetical protein